MHRRHEFGITGLVAAATVLAAASVAAAEDRYMVEDLGTLGGVQSAATDINDDGVVVGWSETATPREIHAFTWERSRGFEDLGTLGGTMSRATAINARGQVIGVSTNIDGEPRGFMIDADGVMRNLIEYLVPSPDEPTSLKESFGRSYYCPVPLLSITEANDISDDGFIAACGYLVTDDVLHGLLLVPSPSQNDPPYTWLDLGRLKGAGYCNAAAINSFRQVVGHSGAEAFLWEYNTIRPLEYTSTWSAATAINDAGTIVGWTDGTGNRPTACMWRDDFRLDLTFEAGFVTQASDINESGLVVGWAAPSVESNHQAILWEGHVVRPLNDVTLVPVRSVELAWDELSEAAAIDDEGRIVGFGTSLKNGTVHAFMLMPIDPTEE